MNTRPGRAASTGTRVIYLKCEDDSPAYDQSVFPLEVTEDDDRYWYGYRVGLPRPTSGPIPYPRFAWKALPRFRGEIPAGGTYQEALDDPFAARRCDRCPADFRVMHVLARDPHGTILRIEPTVGHTDYPDLERAQAAALALVEGKMPASQGGPSPGCRCNDMAEGGRC